MLTKVYNLIILDESGSMESIKQPTIQGFNELLESIKHSIKENPGIAQYVNFFSFNGNAITEHLPLVKACHLNGLKPENYNPDSSTPLYDAIGFSVNKLKKAIDKEEDYSVLVTILTDGEENASLEYTHAAIAALIAELKSKGWVFTYIGANHNVEKTASDLNISNSMLFNTDEESTRKMFNMNLSSRKKFMDKLSSGDNDVTEDFFKED